MSLDYDDLSRLICWTYYLAFKDTLLLSHTPFCLKDLSNMWKGGGSKLIIIIYVNVKIRVRESGDEAFSRTADR